jgi:hypothetical protein
MAIDRANIVQRAGIRADQDASGFPTTAQRNLVVDECAKTVWYDLIAAGWPTAFTTTTVTASGATDYQLNSGNPIHSVQAVFYKVGNDLQELRRVSPEDLAALRSASSAGSPSSQYEVYVDMATGPRIRFYPTASSGSYLVDHIPEWPGFSGDTDVWRGPARSDELIVLMSAAKFLRKEGSEAGARALDTEYASLWDRVLSQASHFYRKDPPRIRDVQTQVQRSPFDFFVAGPYRDY